MRTYSSTIQSF